MMQVSPENILEMPNAFLLVDKVKSRLADEQKKRRHFYEIVEENKKDGIHQRRNHFSLARQIAAQQRDKVIVRIA
ncbi:MAG: hypothetical protein WKF71_10750 [Pyrinomonadaceae bacterium]